MTSNWTSSVHHIRVARDVRIVGGYPAKLGEFPHQVAITYNDDFICGGSIIGVLTVLTAAHCVFSSRFPHIFHFKVIAGIQNINDVGVGEQVRSASFIYKHENYSRVTLMNDIAIIKLSTPLEFTMYVGKISLPEKNETFDGYATVSGWGTTEQGFGSEQLRKVSVPIVSTDVCRASYHGKYNITEDMICMGDSGGDSCKGDSGGAAICKRNDYSLVQCGIVSFGRGCAQEDIPGVYTMVTHYTEWIKSIQNNISVTEIIRRQEEEEERKFKEELTKLARRNEVENQRHRQLMNLLAVRRKEAKEEEKLKKKKKCSWYLPCAWWGYFPQNED